MPPNVPETNQPSQLYGVPDAARFLSLSERQVRNLIKNNEISFVRIGKRLSISQAQLDEFVATHQH